MSGLNNFIWYEKWRPGKLEDMVLSGRCKSDMEHYVEEQNIPHLFLFGPQGSGKTTIAKILIDTIKSITLELNASSEDRGVATIRGKIKQFASSQTPNKEIKVVFLDEADGLTRDAQMALKNTIEKYSKTCRFILTANHPEMVIPELQSRCIKYQFKSFSKKRCLKLLKKIAKKEGFKKIDEDILSKLIDLYYPDIRSVVNALQSFCIDPKSGIDVFNNTIDLKDFDKLIKEGKVSSLRKLISDTNTFHALYKHLFSTTIVKLGKKKEESMADAALVIADYLHRDGSVADRELNFLACCIQLMKVFKCKIFFLS